MKSQVEERLYQAVSWLMTGDGSPQHRLILATHYLETITEGQLALMLEDKRQDVLKRLNRLRKPGEVWAEGEIKKLGDAILDMYVAVRFANQSAKDTA
jgi:hypothetical protein